jgi:type IV secretory pathway TrbD component
MLTERLNAEDNMKEGLEATHKVCDGGVTNMVMRVLLTAATGVGVWAVAEVVVDVCDALVAPQSRVVVGVRGVLAVPPLARLADCRWC